MGARRRTASRYGYVACDHPLHALSSGGHPYAVMSTRHRRVGLRSTCPLFTYLIALSILTVSVASYANSARPIWRMRACLCL